jgi:hypothetical protein
MKTITVQMLKNKYACQSQIRKFKKMFGNSANVTIKNCVTVADKFNFEWALYVFFRISCTNKKTRKEHKEWFHAPINSTKERIALKKLNEKQAEVFAREFKKLKKNN